MTRPAAALVACVLATGCGALLPRSSSTTEESWQSFEEAAAAVERLVPGRTTRGELKEARIDPYVNPGVSLLSFSEVAQRFALGSAVGPEELDSGVRACLTAGKACTGYSITVRRVDRRRSGTFLYDFLNFQRETDVTGWTFNALILLVGDTVVYTLHSGQPKIHEREVSRNPLGPLQGIGEGVGGRLIPD